MKRIFLLLMLVIPFTVFAQHESFKGEPFIEVTGNAHQEIEPNEIYVTVRLKEFEENREKTPLEKLDKEFLAAMKNAGIDRSRLELADVGSQLGKLGKRDKDAFREKTYQIKLTSAAELEKFVANLESVKVDFADIIRVTHSDIDKIKIDLKIKALQAAKSKAEYLVKAVGAEVGKPLMIRDWDLEPVQPLMEYRANIMVKNQAQEMDGSAQQEPQVGFRKIRLQAQVTAQFEIK
jgi:uncharacterized protein